MIYLLTEDVYTTTNQVMANAQAKEVDLLSIPISILYIIMQKFYVEGITNGAVKG